MLAALVADEDVLITVLLDAVANHVERIEDDIYIHPDGCTRDDQHNSLDLRFRHCPPIMLLEQLPGCCHINSTSLQVGVPISHQATLAAIFHASNASSQW